MSHPWFDGDRPRVLAHRGFVPTDSEGVSENSFAAVAAAHAAGASYIESDCHLSADGTVVLFHDDDLARVTGVARPIAETRDRELEQLMSDRGGLLTLPQALESFPTLRFNLDVKTDAAAGPVGHVIAPHAERVLVTSFSDRRRVRALAAAAEAGGRPATSAGTSRTARVLAAAASRSRLLVGRALRGVDALQVPERHGAVRIVTPRLIRAVQAHGVEVHVWTVNDARDMRRLLAWGVDGLVTDRTDRAMETVRALR